MFCSITLGISSSAAAFFVDEDPVNTGDQADGSQQDSTDENSLSERWAARRAEEAQREHEEAVRRIAEFDLDANIVRCLRASDEREGVACMKVMVFYRVQEAGTHNRSGD